MTTKWWHLGTDEAARTLQTDARTGLGSAVADEKLRTFGPNELQEKKGRGPLAIFLDQFKSLLIGVLIAAALISGFLKEWVDAVAILAIVILNAILGLVQEYRADKKTVARLIVAVNRASVRAGMVELIQQLREMADVGINDFKIGAVTYWGDKHLQDKLDQRRTDFWEDELTPIQQTRNGTTYYTDYRAHYGNLESVASGTAVFKLDDVAGTNQATTGWSCDYVNGIITFTADRAGTSYFLTGRSYDLNAAAADVWRVKAANAAKMYNFSAGGQSFQRNQFMANCLQMAQYYEGMAAPTNISLYRGDNEVTDASFD